MLLGNDQPAAESDRSFRHVHDTLKATIGSAMVSRHAPRHALFLTETGVAENCCSPMLAPMTLGPNLVAASRQTGALAKRNTKGGVKSRLVDKLSVQSHGWPVHYDGPVRPASGSMRVV